MRNKIHRRIARRIARPVPRASGGPFDRLTGLLMRVFDESTSYRATLESGVPVLTGEEPADHLAVVEVPCVTGNGSSYAISGSNLGITGSANRTLCFRCKLATTDLQTVASYGATSNGTYFSAVVLSNKWYFQGVSADLDTGVSADTNWHHHAISYDGTSVRWYIDGALVATGAATLNTTDGPLNLLRRAGFNDLHSNASMCDVVLYNSVKTLSEIQSIRTGVLDQTNLVAYWPCQDGHGPGTTNRTIHDAIGTNHLTITSGTVAASWANGCAYARDWCIQYGGGLSVKGAFVPGSPGSGLDSLGFNKVFEAGKHGNPYSRLVPNYFAAAALDAVGVTSSVKLAPRDSLGDSAAANCGFNRIGSTGSDRYFIYASALGAAGQANLAAYTAPTDTNLSAIRGFTDANYYFGPDNSGPTTFGTMRVLAKLLSVPPASTDKRSIVSRVSTGDVGFALRTGDGADGVQAVVGSSKTTPSIPVVSDDIGKWFIFHVTHDGTTLDLYLNGLLFATIAASASSPSSTSGLWVGRAQLSTGLSASHWAIADIAFSAAISFPEAIEADANRIMGDALFALDLPSQTFRFNADDAGASWVSRSGSLTLTRAGTITTEALS